MCLLVSQVKNIKADKYEWKTELDIHIIKKTQYIIMVW